MARRVEITEDQLQGFKYLKQCLPLLDGLHHHKIDKVGNRVLHFDQYIALSILFMFSPIVTSMRGLVQASGLRKVQRELGVSPTSLGSFSEAGAVFDPELIRPMIAELGSRLQPLHRDSKLEDLPGALLAVDGTEVKALSKLVGAAMEGRAVKLHTHFDILQDVPVDMTVTAAGESEVQDLRRRLLPNRVYVMDRGYSCFRLFQEVIDIGSHVVCRARDNSVYQVIETRELTADDREAGILSDKIVRLGCASKRDELRQPVRIVEVACTPHRKRAHTGRGGPEQSDRMLLVTTLLDIPSFTISLIYRKRWMIELFFRFFKQLLGCRHLISHHTNGITIQVYVAILVCMLLALRTGRKATRRTLEMIQFHLMGWADLDEVEAHIASLKPIGAAASNAD